MWPPYTLLVITSYAVSGSWGLEKQFIAGSSYENSNFFLKNQRSILNMLQRSPQGLPRAPGGRGLKMKTNYVHPQGSQGVPGERAIDLPTVVPTCRAAKRAARASLPGPCFHGAWRAVRPPWGRRPVHSKSGAPICHSQPQYPAPTLNPPPLSGKRRC